MNTGWIRSHFHVVALVAALVLAGLSWFAAQRYLAVHAERVESRLAERHARTRVLVAGADLAPGTLLSTATLATREMPVRYVPSSAARVDDLARVEGQRLLAPLKAGDPIAWNALAGGDVAFSTQLAPGSRAITFPVDEVNALAGLLVPGDVVDLLYTERRGAEAVIRPLLQKVTVLATGTTTEKPTVDPATGQPSTVTGSFTTVTLSVTPDEAQRIVLAQHAGELTAVLRHPADAASLASSPLGSSALSGESRPRRTPRSIAVDYVELIVGGARAGGAARSREALEPQAPASGSASPPPPSARPIDAGSVRSRLGLNAASTR